MSTTPPIPGLRPLPTLLPVAILTSFLVSGPCLAGPRASASYKVSADSTDAAGGLSNSASFTNTGSLGGIGGIGSGVSGDGTLFRQGYAAQLSEIFGLALNATPNTVNEGATRQLTATATMDDFTTTTLSGGDVGWLVNSGPITSISATGLATAGTVYQNTVASVQGMYLGMTAVFNLTVVNIGTDDYGIYAGDRIDDDWQNTYFGAGNVKAGPTQDPDGDGQNNLFEFTAGVVPNDANSRFRVRIEPVTGQPAQKAIFFRPLVAGRTYTLMSGGDVTGTFTALSAGLPTQTTGDERQITDTSATAPQKFYKVMVNKP